MMMMSSEAGEGGVKYDGESFENCSDNLRMQINGDGDDDNNNNESSLKIGDRLCRMISELHAAREDILSLESKVAETEDAKMRATRAEQRAEKAEEMLRKQLEKTQNLEKELMEKNSLMEALELELAQTKELHVACKRIASDTIAELEKVKDELEKKSNDQNRYIQSLEIEMKELVEKSSAGCDEVAALKDQIGMMKAELEQMKTVSAHSKDRVLEAQVENALLKVELHKCRSKAAAAEAAEAGSNSEKLAVNRALQLAAASYDNSCAESSSKFSKQAARADATVMISRKEYDELVKMSERTEEAVEQKLEKLRRELTAATQKSGEFRRRAEQAISRAEAAEKAKAELEHKIKQRREKKIQEKQELAAIREEVISRESSSSSSSRINLDVENTPQVQTLANVLQISM